MKLFLLLTVTMLIFWGIGQKVKNPGLVDVFWPIGFILIGYFCWFSNPNPTIYNLIPKLLLLIWGTRLFTFLLFTRVLPFHIEKRYDHLLESKHYNFATQMLIQFVVQLVLIVLISTPIYLLVTVPILECNLVYSIGVGLTILSIILESICDLQLYLHRSHDQGSICQTGLWRFSRHPNYFFDWLAWVGFAMMALSVPMGYLGIISPIILLYIMLRITIPVTESYSIKKRPRAYRKYQKETSTFIPWMRKITVKAK